MRQDDLSLTPTPTDDRPGDWWMDADTIEGIDASNRRLTWSGVRVRVALSVLLLFVTVASGVWLCTPREVLFKPGPLTQSHAQILAGTVTTQRCNACHPPSSMSPLSAWFDHAGQSVEPTQSHLCLNCHRDRIADNLAFVAHNLPLTERQTLTRIARSRLKQADADDERFTRRTPTVHADPNALQCATCHREHHGPEHNLRSLSDSQCQTCHAASFESFATSHPKWDGWPYGRGGVIRFSHASHLHKHFPNRSGGPERFDCQSCHPGRQAEDFGVAAPAGEIARSADYESACSRCHDTTLNAQVVDGVDLIALPTLPRNVLGPDTDWPETATGFADGIVPPLTALMLRENDLLAPLTRGLGDANVSGLDWDAAATQRAGQELAIELRRLVHQIATQGQSAAGHRLSRLGIAVGPLQRIFRSLSPQLVAAAYDAWFSGEPAADRTVASLQTSAKIRRVAADEDGLLQLEPAENSGQRAGEVATDSTNLRRDTGLLSEPSPDDPLLSEPSPDDPLLGDPLHRSVQQSAEVSIPFDQETSLPYGGWYVDYNRLAIHYRGAGHADPVMVGMIETFAQLGNGDPVKRRFFESPAAQSCVRCHRGATDVPARWKAEAQVGRLSEFTTFKHRPHLSVSELGACVHCHQVAEPMNHDRHASHHLTDFQPLKKQTCAGCHTKRAAGESCTQCHRYHISK